MRKVPDQRIRRLGPAPERPDGAFVLYWMTAFRRTTRNFSLQRAVEWAVALEKPLVVLEALRCGYPYASDRLHRFILDGMLDKVRRWEGAPLYYYPYVERETDEGKGLLEALGQRACLVVTDDFPAFFLPRMLAAAAGKLPVRMEAVDANGLLPVRAADRAFPTAFAFRRFLQRVLPEHLRHVPCRDPVGRAPASGDARIPAGIRKRWPPATRETLEMGLDGLARLPIDHDVRPVSQRGGEREAGRVLDRFLRTGLPGYAERHNHPDQDATSGLSPYLHFGHVSSHEIFARVARREGWSPGRLAPRATGGRTGWWGMSESAEAFLDQLVTWREIGLNMCVRREDHDRYASLPDWAQETLGKHAADPRPRTYTLEAFREARTHDPLWNAAQRQLLTEGRIHNYLRMVWGKKILEWTASPREALEVMIELNDRYALDGRDPNAYSGIFWVLGRYDRPWGPERKVFGKVRYMSSRNTARKLRLREYLDRYGE